MAQFSSNSSQSGLEQSQLQVLHSTAQPRREENRTYHQWSIGWLGVVTQPVDLGGAARVLLAVDPRRRVALGIVVAELAGEHAAVGSPDAAVDLGPAPVSPQPRLTQPSRAPPAVPRGSRHPRVVVVVSDVVCFCGSSDATSCGQCLRVLLTTWLLRFSLIVDKLLL